MNSSKQIITEYFSLAQDTANNRMQNFENIIIERLTKLETKFDCFKDPSFNWAYRQAQFQSAMTDNENTYQMLCELLIHRGRKMDDKLNQTSVNGAIDIVNQLSDASLSALTIMTCLTIGIKPANLIMPISGCLQTLDNLYSSIITCDLPNDNHWLDQLDILKAIRIRRFSKFHKFEDILSNQFKECVCAGINKDSENYDKALEIQKKLNSDLLIKNELLENYYVLPFIEESAIDSLHIKNGETITPISESEKIEWHKIYNLYEKNSKLDEKVKSNFVDLLNSYKNLNLIRVWWNNLKESFELTSIGKVLGHANAQKSYKGFPPLD